MEAIRQTTNAAPAKGVIYFDVGWASIPSLIGNVIGKRESWYFRTSLVSQVGRSTLGKFGLRPIDLDSLPYLALGKEPLSEPMGSSIDRIGSMALDTIIQRLAHRYPRAQDAAGILRNSILRAMSARGVEAFYAQMWSRIQGYSTVKVVGISRWDKLLLDDRANGVRVTGSISRLCATLGQQIQKIWGFVRRASINRPSRAISQVNSSHIGMRSSVKPLIERTVLLVLNMGENYGGLYSYDYLFSDEPLSPLNRENVIVIARSGGESNGDGLTLGHPSSGSRRNQLRVRMGVMARALMGGGLSVPWGILWYLAGVCSRVDGQRLEIANRYPALELAIFAYDVQVPSELVLAFESLGIPTAALNERPQSVIWELQPFSVGTLLTASPHFSEAASSSRSVSICNAVAMGMWRTDLLHEYRSGPPHEHFLRARQAGQRLVVALPYHAAVQSGWSGNPLAVGVQPVAHFLEELADLAEARPNIFIVIRGKNADWVVDDRFSGIAARIASLPNVTVNGDYGTINESYRLCAGADLVIAKHTSLVDEVLAVGIPCVLHDYTRNSRDLARPTVDYLPRRLWAENMREFQEAVDFALDSDGIAFGHWWEPLRLRLYGNLSDGGVRARARDYLSSLLVEGRSVG